MNLPNWITLSRLLLTVPFLVLLEQRGYELVALGIYVCAALTDWVDGYLARRLDQVTTLGKLLDPLVDKVLVTGALVALSAKGLVPAWSVTAILFREFLVTGLRGLEAERGVIVPAGMLGKLKAVAQMVAIGFLLFALAPQAATWAYTVGMGIYWLAVALTIVSGVQYVWAAKDVFKERP